MRLRHVFLILLAIPLFAAGLYFLHVFELAAKMFALFSILDLLPRSVEWFFPPLAALVLMLCFIPAIVLVLSHKIGWPWLAALTFVFFSSFLCAQQYSYTHLERAAPGASSHPCPWVSASGLMDFASQALFIPPDLQVDVNNEQCMTLRLAHDSGSDWEVFKSKAYDPKYIPIHYSQNVVFPVAVLIRAFIAKKTEISKDPRSLSRWFDQTVLGYHMLDALLFVFEHQEQRVQAEEPGRNPLAVVAQRLLAWEEKLVLKKISETLLSKVRAMFYSEKAQLASEEKTHPEALGQLSDYDEKLDGVERRLNVVVESY